MKRGRPKKSATPGQDVLERLGISSGQTFATAMSEAFDFTIPILPKAGRGPTSMSQAQFEEVVRGVLATLPMSRACNKAGISPATARSWMKKGKTDMEEGARTAQAVFWSTIKQAEALGYEYATTALIHHAKTDWRAAESLLKNRYGFGKEEVEPEEEEAPEDVEQARLETMRKSLPKYAEPPAVITAEEDDETD